MPFRRMTDDGIPPTLPGGKENTDPSHPTLTYKAPGQTLKVVQRGDPSLPTASPSLMDVPDRPVRGSRWG
jgi:hypothetical protein